MIFIKDLLFIHVPKTGGMSTSSFLLDVLQGPVYYSHPFRDEVITNPGVVELTGRRHESLEEARDIVASYGLDVSRFRLILATIRNPYDLEVSRYAYLRAGHPWERGGDLPLALSSSFETFAVKSRHRGGHWWTDAEYAAGALTAVGNGRRRGRYRNDLEGFYTLDGCFPKNLRIIRFEHLVEDLAAALGTIGVEVDGRFPWNNRSSHDHYLSYYTRRAEEAVYRRYRWAFDQGFYPRLDPAIMPLNAEAVPSG